MRKLLILLLGAILIGILSYFCFLDKAGGIKDDLVLKTQSAFASRQMSWVNLSIKGDNLSMTRIVTLEGTAPSEAMKAEAGRVALAQMGVDGVDNRLAIAKTAKVSEPLPTDVKPTAEPSPVIVPVAVKVASKPEPMPIIDVVAPAKVLEKAPVETVYSCQDEFKKILTGGKINFSSNKAAINPDSYPLLNALVNVAKKCPKDTVAIGGHTDSDGSARYNAKLSTNRANAVKKYLISKGISQNRLKAIGYGESKSIADNSTLAGKAKNRRIEFNVKGVR